MKVSSLSTISLSLFVLSFHKVSALNPFASLLASDTKEEISLTAENFDIEVSKPGLHTVKFYSPYCHHCVEFAPHWIKLNETFNGDENEKDSKFNNYNLNFHSVNCAEQGDLCKSKKLRGVPAIWLMGKNSTKQTDVLATFPGAETRNYDTVYKFLKDEVDKYYDSSSVDTLNDDTDDIIGIPDIVIPGTKDENAEIDTDGDDGFSQHGGNRPSNAYGKSNIEKETETENQKGLTIKNFDDVISKNGLHFIKFYSPYCIHCQHLAPIWNIANENLKSSGNDTKYNIHMESVDCAESGDLCSREDVFAYPTLRIYKPNDNNNDIGGVKLTDYFGKKSKPEYILNFGILISKMYKNGENITITDFPKSESDANSYKYTKIIIFIICIGIILHFIKQSWARRNRATRQMRELGILGQPIVSMSEKFD